MLSNVLNPVAAFGVVQVYYVKNPVGRLWRRIAIADDQIQKSLRTQLQS
jgi:hypothetical protein